MKFAQFCGVALLVTFTLAQAQSRIVCEPTSKEVVSSIWPAPYLSEKGSLCFDVKGWPEYAGQNCVPNGGRISWKGTVIVTVDGESKGRDLTSFRVVAPMVSNERIAYTIEWTRDGTWQPMQQIEINRLSGDAVSHLITMHGGEPHQCHLERRKI